MSTEEVIEMILHGEKVPKPRFKMPRQEDHDLEGAIEVIDDTAFLMEDGEPVQRLGYCVGTDLNFYAAELALERRRLRWRVRQRQKNVELAAQKAAALKPPRP